MGENRLKPICGLTTDSRAVRPGYLFAAIPGTKLDGRTYVGEAVKKGAVAVLVPREDAERLRGDLSQKVEVIGVDDVRRAVGEYAAEFHGHPSRRMHLIGITGTNGKTTTSFLIEGILNAAGLSPGLIGTIHRCFGDEVTPSELTTPDAVSLQAYLASLRDRGARSAVMEVSSHALDQMRVAGCQFSVAVFTNLTHDHLDYHGSMDGYFAAKRRLFLELAPKASAINIDCPYGKRLCDLISGHAMTYGMGREAMVRPIDLSLDLTGIRATVETPAGRIEVDSSLIGAHNLMNILAAIAAVLPLGVDAGAIAAGISRVRRVPGRLDPVVSAGRPVAFVDYAHTPDALERVLQTLRTLGPERIITVVGCGGDRDRGKRPLMGRIARDHSDLAIFTMDNPRSEDPIAILDDMCEGLWGSTATLHLPQSPFPREDGKRVRVIPDRREAIRHAVREARPGDCILIAGKGHETYQIIGATRLPFNDLTETTRAIVECEAVPIPNPHAFPFSIRQIAQAAGARILSGNPDAVPVGITTDTRSLQKGELFVALSGNRFDGNAFACHAARAGAAGVLIQDGRPEIVDEVRSSFPDAAVLVAPDTLVALGAIASLFRKALGVRVVGITGSCGKTGTKELVALVLAQRWRVGKTPGNLNNLIGLPLSILRSRPPLDWMVLEMGMNQPGEIARLASIAGPDVGIVTTVKPAHLEGLGSVEGVAGEKSALLQALDGKNGIAVINLDEPLIVERANRLSCRKIGYTLSGADHPKEGFEAVVTCPGWSPHPEGAVITISLRGRETSFLFPLMGRAAVQNALAAAAAGIAVGLTHYEIIQGLSQAKPLPGRIAPKDLPPGITLMDDSYNANPASMEAALETLSIWSGSRPRIAILGDMLELGDSAHLFHQELGRSAARYGVSLLIACGTHGDDVSRGAREAGLSLSRILVFPETRDLVSWIEQEARVHIPENACVLVKGSRGMRLEKAIQALETAYGTETEG